MKNLKRAYRRHKKQTLLKKRAWINFSIHKFSYFTWETYWQNVKAGECDRWMRTLAKRCSCWMCSAKYQRPSKGVVTKLIQDELLD